MDGGDQWAARLAAAAKRQQQQSHHQWDFLGVDDLEADDDRCLEFSCPYCLEDFDISTLCSHIEEEHSCESRGVACPVCGTKVGKDMVAHLTIQHMHLLNIHRRRRLRRGGMPSSTMLSFLGKELREAHLQVLLGGGGVGSRGTGVSGNAADSLVSALVQSMHLLEAEDSSKQIPTIDDRPARSLHLKQHCGSGPEVHLSAEEYEEKIEQATLRASYVQQLLLSTLLDDV